MAGARGYYSLLQYCPDAARAEAANRRVGVRRNVPEAESAADPAGGTVTETITSA